MLSFCAYTLSCTDAAAISIFKTQIKFVLISLNQLELINAISAYASIKQLDLKISGSPKQELDCLFLVFTVTRHTRKRPLLLLLCGKKGNKNVKTLAIFTSQTCALKTVNKQRQLGAAQTPCLASHFCGSITGREKTKIQRKRPRKQWRQMKNNKKRNFAFDLHTVLISVSQNLRFFRWRNKSWTFTDLIYNARNIFLTGLEIWGVTWRCIVGVMPCKSLHVTAMSWNILPWFHPSASPAMWGT